MRRKQLTAVIALIAVLSVFTSCGTNKSTDSNPFAGKTIGVLGGADGELASKEYVGVGAVIEKFTSFSDAVLALEGGRVDYAIADEFTAQKYLTAGRDVKVMGKCSYELDFCACFYDNDALVEEFNTALGFLNKSGITDAIKNAYLSGTAYMSSAVSSGENGTLTMLVDARFEPFESYNEDGELVGIDIDIAREVCAFLGYKLKIEDAEIDNAFSALTQNDACFIMSGITYNEERASVYSFTDVYCTLYYDILERA